MRSQVRTDVIDVPVLPLIRPPMPEHTRLDAARTQRAADVDVVARLEPDRAETPDVDFRAAHALEHERIGTGITVHRPLSVRTPIDNRRTTIGADPRAQPEACLNQSMI